MNHIYRTLWNELSRTFVAVAENVSSRGKRSSSRRTAERSEAAMHQAFAGGLPDAQSPPPAALPGSRILVSGIRPLALEQRFMFDGAGAVEVAEAAAAEPVADGDADAEGSEAATDLDIIAAAYAPPRDVSEQDDAAEEVEAIEPVDAEVEPQPQLVALPTELLSSEAADRLSDALVAVNETLAELVSSEHFGDLAREVFGQTEGGDPEEFEARLSQVNETIRSEGLRIDLELRNSDDLNGAAAAYAPVGHTGTERIYLNADWVAGASSDMLQRVLLEELGHALDQRLNAGIDTDGDEGELFATLLTERALTDSERATIAGDEDGSTLLIEGVAVNVELAATAITDINNYLTTNAALNDLTAAAIPLRITYNGAGNNGADLLVAAFNGNSLIGWTVYNRSSNLDAGSNTSDTQTIDLNFDLEQFKTEFSAGGLTLRAWQGTTGYSTTGNDTRPGLTSGKATNVNFNVNNTSASSNSFSNDGATFDSVTTAATFTRSGVTFNYAPVITSNGGGNAAVVSVVENQSAVSTVTATDASAIDTITYSIVGGVDASKFEINAETGELTFKEAPDFEAPTDIGPIVGDVVTTNFGNSTSGTLTLPSNLQKGDIIIIGIGSDGSAPALPSGWTNINNTSTGGGNEYSRTAYLVVGDTTPANPSITGISTASVGFAVAIRGLDAGATFSPTPAAATGSSGMPDAPNLASTGQNSLVLAIGYLDDDNVPSVTAPAGYTLLASAQASTTGQTIMVAYKFDNNASDDPAAFGGTGSDDWVALTLSLGVLPRPTDNAYQVIVQASDGKGGIDLQTITVNVTDANDAPTAITLSNSSVDENVATGTVVGTLSTTDPDVTAGFAGSFVSTRRTRLAVSLRCRRPAASDAAATPQSCCRAASAAVRAHPSGTQRVRGR